MRNVCFCSPPFRYLLRCAGVGRGADLLSHEATFSKEMAPKAAIAKHSTAAMAGAFARRLGAAQLVLTHFSSRYVERREARAQT